jgi:opacity protein-like surface antigen
MKKLVSLLSLALLSGPAWAADIEQYVGVDYSWTLFENKNGTRLTPSGVRARYGQYLIPHFAVEAHYLYGTQDDNIIFGTDAGGKFSLKHTASLFLRGDIGSTIKLYGLVGWSYTTFKVTGAFPVQQEESDLSYGGGIEYHISKNTAIDASYIIYHDEKYFDFTASSLGVTYHF